MVKEKLKFLKRKGKKEVKAKEKTLKKEKKVEKKTKKEKIEKKGVSEQIKAWKILSHPHLTEKSINNVELNNELVFIVKRNSSRKDVKKAVEDLFEVRIERVNILTDTKGRKKAFVKLTPDYLAIDIATRLGMI